MAAVKILNIFVKYKERDGENSSGMSTIQEHMQVCKDKGAVAWGHFTETKPEFNKNHLSRERTKVLDKQLKNGEHTLVFFYSSEGEKKLHVADLVGYYDRNDADSDKHLIELIPQTKYYENGVGSIDFEKDIGRLKAYAFFEVKNLRKIDISDAEDIYTIRSGKKILEIGGQSSLFYVNISEELYDKLIK